MSQLARGVVIIAGYVLVALSAISFGLGGWLASRALLFSDDVVKTTGIVSGYRTSPQKDGKIAHTPRIVFQSGSHERTTIFGQVTTPAPRFAEGASVPLRYRSGDPGSARIDTFVDNALGPTAGFVLGALTSLAALLLIRSGREPR
jgi:hypothetical protein